MGVLRFLQAELSQSFTGLFSVITAFASHRERTKVMSEEGTHQNSVRVDCNTNQLLQNTIIAFCLQIAETRKLEDRLHHKHKGLDILLAQRNRQVDEKDAHIHNIQTKLAQSGECLSSLLRANSRLVECLEETNKRAACAEQREREWRRKAQQAALALEERISHDRARVQDSQKPERSRFNHRV
ncbi:hypothetical protein P175DRAFT_0556223 [Aspergillus ochraceoroseus IBT 24754]|uniref:Autophagy-related protein 16 domain-containing protein n=1 Tax=Aspergillus ochraceoroseus IBT 24754 TaxID=1392256 RepID=A0A2T5M4W5_9EURO|nr:uncharacterized protein P175DRAFT_0556223 [Aspergillus ochraceoroseus IBT 24754]PTU23583.1 hypothetical protein P175DRAFT_0556223 [Aspergillus ochraceoroseus IBT 24754]